MKSVLLVLLALTFTAPAVEEEIDWRPDRKLTWDDFKPRAGHRSMYKAFSHTGIEYTITAPNRQTVEVKIRSYFIPEKSWVNPRNKNDYLLNHEQRHFDLTALYGYKLDSAMAQYEVSIREFKEKRLYHKIDSTFNAMYAELDDLQDQYDREADHSLNRAEQARWDAWIDAQLEKWVE
jgi:hypothetical protein